MHSHRDFHPTRNTVEPSPTTTTDEEIHYFCSQNWHNSITPPVISPCPLSHDVIPPPAHPLLLPSNVPTKSVYLQSFCQYSISSSSGAGGKHKKLLDSITILFPPSVCTLRNINARKLQNSVDSRCQHCHLF